MVCATHQLSAFQKMKPRALASCINENWGGGGGGGGGGCNPVLIFLVFKGICLFSGAGENKDAQLLNWLFKAHKCVHATCVSSKCLYRIMAGVVL